MATTGTRDCCWYLLARGGARWIAAPPDFDLEILDLSAHRVVPVPRNAPLLAALGQDRLRELYTFDPMDRVELDDLMRQARGLAALVGFGEEEIAVAGGRWRLADLSSRDFGETVPVAALADPDQVMMRENIGLIRVQRDGEDVWSVMERVDDDDFDEWKLRKANSVHADRRVLPVMKDHHDVRFRSEASALEAWRKEKIPEFPLRGPPATREWFESLRAAGQTLLQHHMEFIRKSGVPERGGVAREHGSICESLRQLICHDQVDCTGLVGVEVLIRRLIVIEMAVARNPRTPDWDGLELVMAARIGDMGEAQVQGFETWLSGAQRDQAIVLKQGRLPREERAAQEKRTQGGGGGGDQRNQGGGGGGNSKGGRGRGGRGNGGGGQQQASGSGGGLGPPAAS